MYFGRNSNTFSDLVIYHMLYHSVSKLILVRAKCVRYRCGVADGLNVWNGENFDKKIQFFDDDDDCSFSFLFFFCVRRRVSEDPPWRAPVFGLHFCLESFKFIQSIYNLWWVEIKVSFNVFIKLNSVDILSKINIDEKFDKR
jgi:hypothetical protein